VAKGAMVRIFIYTMGKGFNKFVVEDGILTRSETYQSIKLVNGDNLALIQGHCPRILSPSKYGEASDQAQQYLNATPIDLPLDLFAKFGGNKEKAIKAFFQMSEQEKDFFLETKVFHAKFYIKMLDETTSSDIINYGMKVVRLEDGTLDITSFALDATQSLITTIS